LFNASAESGFAASAAFVGTPRAGKVAHLLQHHAHVGKGVVVAWILREDGAEHRERLVLLPERGERIAQVVLRLGPIGESGERAPVRVGGFGMASRDVVCGAERIQRVGEVRLHLRQRESCVDRTRVRVCGFGEAPGGVMRHAFLVRDPRDEVAHRRVPRLHRLHGLDFGTRLGQPPQLEERMCAVLHERDDSGARGLGAIEPAERFVEPSLGCHHDAHHLHRFGIVRGRSQQQAQRALRFGEAAGAGERHGAREAGRRAHFRKKR
jgi:hypothetical protein